MKRAGRRRLQAAVSAVSSANTWRIKPGSMSSRISTQVGCSALRPEMGHKGPQGHGPAAALPADRRAVTTPALQPQARAGGRRQPQSIAIGDLAIPSLPLQGHQGCRSGAQARSRKLGRLRSAGQGRLKPTGRPHRIAPIGHQNGPRRGPQGPRGKATELDDRRRRCFGRLQCRTQAPGFRGQKRHRRRRHGHRCHRHRRHRRRREGQGQGHGKDRDCLFSATTVPSGCCNGFQAPAIPGSARRLRQETVQPSGSLKKRGVWAQAAAPRPRAIQRKSPSPAGSTKRSRASRRANRSARSPRPGCWRS